MHNVELIGMCRYNMMSRCAMGFKVLCCEQWLTPVAADSHLYAQHSLFEEGIHNKVRFLFLPAAIQLRLV